MYKLFFDDKNKKEYVSKLSDLHTGNIVEQQLTGDTLEYKQIFLPLAEEDLGIFKVFEYGAFLTAVLRNDTKIMKEICHNPDQVIDTRNYNPDTNERESYPAISWQKAEQVLQNERELLKKAIGDYIAFGNERIDFIFYCFNRRASKLSIDYDYLSARDELGELYREIFNAGGRRRTTPGRITYSYRFNDPLLIPWFELIEAVKNQHSFKVCANKNCRCYYLHGLRKTSKYCFYCNTPYKRRSTDEQEKKKPTMDPEKTIKKESFMKRYQRDGDLDELNSLLHKKKLIEENEIYIKNGKRIKLIVREGK